jgi:hypothetical protein
VEVGLKLKQSIPNVVLLCDSQLSVKDFALECVYYTGIVDKNSFIFTCTKEKRLIGELDVSWLCQRTDNIVHKTH